MLTGATGLIQLLNAGDISGVAVLVDLRAVPHAENPLFRQSIIHLIDRFAAQFEPEVVDVGRYAQVFLFSSDKAEGFVAKLQAVAANFAEQHVTAPRVSIFRLPAESGRLAVLLRNAGAEPEPPAPVATLSPEEMQQLASLHKLATYERVLLTADVSALVRESPVWQLQDGHWQTAFSEVTVALDNLERAVGTPLRRDPWLLQQITPILDRRIIRHFQYEPSRLSSPRSMNLLPASVQDPAFYEFVRELTYDQRRNLIVELSATDPDLTEAGLNDALETLRLWDCRVAIDHLSLRHADPGFLPLDEIDYLKIDIGGLGAEGTDLPRVPDWMARFGLGKLVALCPEAPHQLRACLSLGFQLVERQERPLPIGRGENSAYKDYYP
ncbi:EAL domain-containing protein [Niveispirillum irakense]|uniref:EAL domain-containing protein n=1 Tax=Niveispirillum irakense TaxID=34011 RepID=UPI000411EDA1|nr:EAL domain-containing protein [Niveispirillum irakense]